MAQITAALVKELRDQTGAGMMDSKKALTETDGDMEAALDWLRSKGLSAAAKKSGRAAAEGLVGVVVSEDGKTAALVELNSETDFVARNEQFQDVVRGIAKVALTTDGTLDALKAAPATTGDGTIEDMVTRLIATIGENMTLRRSGNLSVDEGAVAAYMHSAVTDGLGKIGVMVAIQGADSAAAATIGKQVAMHIAATNPMGLTEQSIDPTMLEREKRVLMETAREAGKSDAGIESWSTKQLAKYVKENTLLLQKFVLDSSKTVQQAVKAAGEDFEIIGFSRFALGEGVEKKEEDFAAEVAATAGGN